MQQFIDALKTLNLTDIFKLFALITPIVAFIWYALRWAYKERLATLQTHLQELRTDFDRRVQRKEEEIEAQYKGEVNNLKTTVDKQHSQLESLRADFQKLHELSYPAFLLLKRFLINTKQSNEGSRSLQVEVNNADPGVVEEKIREFLTAWAEVDNKYFQTSETTFLKNVLKTMDRMAGRTTTPER